MVRAWISPIPRNIHLIWIGTNPYPDYFKLFLTTFVKFLPEFSIKVWTNKDLTKKNFPKTFTYIQKAKKIHGKQIKDENGNKMYNKKMEPLRYSKWAQITDLMRLEIIYNQGGYYFDTTFEILKPLYNILNKRKYKFIGCNEVPRFKDYHILSNSFFGATKNNVIIKRLLTKKKLDNIDFYDILVDFQTGPGFLRSGINLNDNFYIFPSKYFYPFIEEYAPGEDQLYRKSEKNKCHKIKSKKKGKDIKTLKNKKGSIIFPCKAYPKSYALKHWQLGKSWLISEYYIK